MGINFLANFSFAASFCTRTFCDIKYAFCGKYRKTCVLSLIFLLRKFAKIGRRYDFTIFFDNMMDELIFTKFLLRPSFSTCQLTRLTNQAQ